MNFAQMLASTVTPLSAYTVARDAEYKARKREEKKAKQEIDHRNQSGHIEAVARYKEAWRGGNDWLPTREIELRLGLGKCIVSPTLKKWCLDYKILERRPVGGEIYKRHLGFEWRWAE